MDTYGLAAGHGRGPGKHQTIGVVVLWGLGQKGPGKRAPGAG